MTDEVDDSWRKKHYAGQIRTFKQYAGILYVLRRADGRYYRADEFPAENNHWTWKVVEARFFNSIRYAKTGWHHIVARTRAEDLSGMQVDIVPFELHPHIDVIPIVWNYEPGFVTRQREAQARAFEKRKNKK